MGGRPTWAEVSLARLRENFGAVRALIGPDVRLLAVVKANAYGHGAVEVARTLATEGADWFGVTSVGEALPLRRSGLNQPILLLSGFWPGEEEALVEHELTPSISSEDQLRLLEQYSGKYRLRLPFHLKIDTGFRRLGVPAAEVARFLERLHACKYVRLEGLYTHLASADEASLERTREQLELFARVREQVEQAGFHAHLVHAANSAALGRCPESHGNMVRPGLALYGYQLCATPLQLHPALSLKSRVLALRWVSKGDPVGYGGSYVARERALVATVCAGYADGVNRALSNRGRALVRGSFVPLVGRVSMDYTLLDVTAIAGVEVGDEVVFIGCQGAAQITAAEVAELAGTIPYEILCNIGPRVPRVYLPC